MCFCGLGMLPDSCFNDISPFFEIMDGRTAGETTKSTLGSRQVLLKNASSFILLAEQGLREDSPVESFDTKMRKSRLSSCVSRKSNVGFPS